MTVDLSAIPSAQLLAYVADQDAPRNALLASLHEKQLDFVLSEARFNVALAGRRSGKTTAASAILALGLEDCGFDEACIYLARTREVARRLIWGKLKELQRRFGFRWTFNEATLEVRNERGGYIVVAGVDKPLEIEKLRGLKARVVVLDEPATYAAVLSPLTRDVLEPALGDLRGQMFATGTPGIVCAGWWHEVSTGASSRAKWRRFHWTVLDNPFFRDAAAWIDEILAENGWTREHPTFVREILARWVHSVDDLVYRVTAANIIETPPADYDRNTWRHVLAIDYGVTDSTAWAVLAWRVGGKVVLLVSEKRAGLAPSAVADITKAWADAYSPEAIVGDAGGLGKAMIAEMNTRYPGIPIQAADKTQKRAAIEHLNGDLSSGNVLIVRNGNSALLAEAAVLPWKLQKVAIAGDFVVHEVPDPGYEDHLCDAMLYGYRATTAFYRPDPTPELPENPLELARQHQPWDAFDEADLLF